MTVVVRSASAADLDAIAAVETACFDAPWSRDVFVAELERALARLIVATDIDGAVIGFACTWHVVDEAHLLRIAVLPQHRRHRHAAVLLERVVADARAAGCVHVDLEVGRANAAASALYARAGFIEVGARRGYYQHPPDDAVLLRLILDPA